METLLLGPRDVGLCADILKRGGVAAVPTETVYGLAANGLSPEAVRRIFAAKGRPEAKPISLFVTGLADAERFCRVNEAARRLSRFWPGPLTVILPRRAIVPDEITAGGEGVGVRAPDDKATLELLRLVAVSGAEALAIFRGRVDAVLDGGVCPGGVPSTVVDLTGDIAKIVRLGALSKEAIEKTLGAVVK